MLLPAPILHAELHVAGVRVVCDQTKLAFSQPTDFAGRPSGGVRLVVFEVTLSGPAAFLPVWQAFKFDVFRRESGYLVWQTQRGQSVRRLTFFDAACTVLAFSLDARGQSVGAAAGLRLRFSPAAVELQGTFVELHSRLSWEKEAAVRRRALVPPFPLPLLGPPPVPRPLVPPDLPPRPLGPLGPLVGRALGLAGLLLLPANDADAPGYETERQFSKANAALRRDVARLAYLEQEQAHRALSAQEEAEYVTLLAKVKGIHGSSLSDENYNKQWDANKPEELTNFDLEKLMHHVEYRDYSVKRKNGIGGAHNIIEWNKHQVDYVEISRTPHPSVQGIEKVKYQIYALDAKGNPDGNLVNQPFDKTIYDPNYWPRPRLERAFKEAVQSARNANDGRLPTGWWEGRTSQGDIIIGVYRDGNITTFFFK